MDAYLNALLDKTMPDMAANIMPVAIVPAVLIMFAVVVFIAVKMLGWRSTVAMLLPGMVIAYGLEELGVHTGIVFGHYHFNPPMGPKLDVIPLVHPFLWISIIFLAWIVTNLFLEGSPLPKKLNHSTIIWNAIICALFVSTLDITGDPFSVKYGLWTWEDGGRFFGVPYHNWFVVALIPTILHNYVLRYERKKGVARPVNSLEEGPKWVRILSIFPFLFFGGSALFFVALNYEGILGLVTVYAMILPILIGLWKWIRWYKGTKTVVVS